MALLTVSYTRSPYTGGGLRRDSLAVSARRQQAAMKVYSCPQQDPLPHYASPLATEGTHCAAEDVACWHERCLAAGMLVPSCRLHPASAHAVSPGVSMRTSSDEQGRRGMSSRLLARSGPAVEGAPACSGTCAKKAIQMWDSGLCNQQQSCPDVDQPWLLFGCTDI